MVKLSTTQLIALGSADEQGFIEPTSLAGGYRTLDALARRGLVEHVDGRGRPCDGPVRRRVGNKYGTITPHGRVVRDDYFRITKAGRGHLALAARDARERVAMAAVNAVTAEELGT